MQFTYDSYRNLINILKENGYSFAEYSNYSDYSKCVILRHDIDMCIDSSLRLAEIEKECGVCSTYFVLLKTDLYNVASLKSLNAIRKILEMGHNVGLHFDEMSYDENIDIRDAVKEESQILGKIIGRHINVVSMHRPSKKTLKSNYQFDGLINSYENIFFKDFKYVSDSRRTWREPVEDIIRSGLYNKLHILTHAFWYSNIEESFDESICKFVNNASHDRLESLEENITDLKYKGSTEIV